VPTLLAMQAAAHLRHGEIDGAEALLAEARHLAAETGERWFEPEIIRLAGEVLAATGRREEAEIELRQAARLAKRQGARLWRRRALASLRRLRSGQRPHGRASGHLVPSP